MNNAKYIVDRPCVHMTRLCVFRWHNREGACLHEWRLATGSPCTQTLCVVADRVYPTERGVLTFSCLSVFPHHIMMSTYPTDI